MIGYLVMLHLDNWAPRIGVKCYDHISIVTQFYHIPPSSCYDIYKVEFKHGKFKYHSGWGEWYRSEEYTVLELV